MIERGVAVLARRGELLEEPLGAVHEPGARVIERERKGAALRNRRRRITAQPRMDGDRPLHFTTAPKYAAERKLDLHRITVHLGHAREDLRGAVEAIVDQM